MNKCLYVLIVLILVVYQCPDIAFSNNVTTPIKTWSENKVIVSSKLLTWKIEKGVVIDDKLKESITKDTLDFANKVIKKYCNSRQKLKPFTIQISASNEGPYALHPNETTYVILIPNRLIQHWKESNQLTIINHEMVHIIDMQQIGLPTRVLMEGFAEFISIEYGGTGCYDFPVHIVENNILNDFKKYLTNENKDITYMPYIAGYKLFDYLKKANGSEKIIKLINKYTTEKSFKNRSNMDSFFCALEDIYGRHVYSSFSSTIKSSQGAGQPLTSGEMNPKKILEPCFDSSLLITSIESPNSITIFNRNGKRYQKHLEFKSFNIDYLFDGEASTIKSFQILDSSIVGPRGLKVGMPIQEMIRLFPNGGTQSENYHELAAKNSFIYYLQNHEEGLHQYATWGYSTDMNLFTSNLKEDDCKYMTIAFFDKNDIWEIRTKNNLISSMGYYKIR